MKTLSLSEAKMKLSELVDSVHFTDEEVVITRNGRPAAVLISPDEFESWKETLVVKADQDLMDQHDDALCPPYRGHKKKAVQLLAGATASGSGTVTKLAHSEGGVKPAFA